MSSIGYSAEGLAVTVSTIALRLTLSIGLGISEVFTLSIVIDNRLKVVLPIAAIRDCRVIWVSALFGYPRCLGIRVVWVSVLFGYPRCLKLTTVLG